MCVTTYLFIHDQISPGFERETTAGRETNLSFKISLMYRHICRILWSVNSQEPRTQAKDFLEMQPSTMTSPHLTPDADSLALFCSVLQNLTVLPLWIPGIRKWGDRVAWSGLSGKSWERRQNCPAVDQWEQNLDMRSWSMESTWWVPGPGARLCCPQGTSAPSRRCVFTGSELGSKQQTTKHRGNYKRAQMIVL